MRESKPLNKAIAIAVCVTVVASAAQAQSTDGLSLLGSSRTNLLGDIYGVRPLLNEYGISLG